MATPRPPIPRLPGGPDPEQPVPRDPVAGVDLAAFARIAAGLAEAPASRAAVLAGAGLDEARWLEVEKTWLLRLAVAGLQGDVALLQEHDAAVLAAQAEIAAGAPPLPLEEYARIVAALEGGRDPSAFLAEAKLSAARFAQSHRAWAARLAADPALAASFRALVQSARAARAGG